jgi:fatty acid desaturase
MVIKGEKKKRKKEKVRGILSLFIGSTSSILKGVLFIYFLFFIYIIILLIYIFTLTLLYICNPCSFIYRLFEPYQEEHRVDEHRFSEVEAALSNVSMYWPLSPKPFAGDLGL